MTLRVVLHPREAATVLRDAPPEIRRKVKAALKRLSEDPTGRASRLDVKELRVDEPGPRVYRLKLGEWRLAYSVRRGQLFVHRVFHRSEGYGWLERLGSAKDETA